jgi:hypothetical protein
LTLQCCHCHCCRPPAATAASQASSPGGQPALGKKKRAGSDGKEDLEAGSFTTSNTSITDPNSKNSNSAAAATATATAAAAAAASPTGLGTLSLRKLGVGPGPSESLMVPLSPRLRQRLLVPRWAPAGLPFSDRTLPELQGLLRTLEKHPDLPLHVSASAGGRGCVGGTTACAGMMDGITLDFDG